MRELQEEVELSLLNKKNVVGVGIGHKWTNGQNTGEDAILVFVAKKAPIGALQQKDIVPSSIDGIKTDVVGKTGFISPLALTQKVRPIRPGYSCGHGLATAGTIGGFFKDWEGQIVGLSNNHVIAATNRGRNMVDRIYQPGVYDRNPSGNEIGILKRYRTLSSHASYNAADRRRIYGYNLEDSGIFYISDTNNMDCSIPSVGIINGWNDDIGVGDQLQKTGRTTEYTTNSVIAINATMRVSYGRVNYLFKDQIVTNAMSQGGDSGSLTLDMNRNAAGLLFAGSSTVTIHNRIRYPRASFGLQIYNPVQIDESIEYTLTVDGSNQPNNYGIADFNKAMEDVRKHAMEGSDATVTASFSANPS